MPKPNEADTTPHTILIAKILKNHPPKCGLRGAIVSAKLRNYVGKKAWVLVIPLEEVKDEENTV